MDKGSGVGFYKLEQVKEDTNFMIPGTAIICTLVVDPQDKGTTDEVAAP